MRIITMTKKKFLNKKSNMEKKTLRPNLRIATPTMTSNITPTTYILDLQFVSALSFFGNKYQEQLQETLSPFWSFVLPVKWA